MRVLLIALAGVSLGGCAVVDGYNAAYANLASEMAARRQLTDTILARYRAQSAACPNAPDPYDCARLADAQFAASLDSLGPIRSASVPARPGAASRTGQVVYSASQCIGAVVNGQCHGSIMPDAAYHPTCHGEMIGGQCTGPMF